MKHFFTAIFAAQIFLFSALEAALPIPVEVPKGAYGVWEVAETGTRTPIYSAEGTGQKWADMENAAFIRAWGDGRLIGDHADSVVDGGVWNVNEHIVGGMAFLVRDGKPTKRYQCTAIYLCDDTGSTYLYNGKSIRAAKGDIICGSCASDKPHDKVYIAYYKYSGELEEPQF